MTFLEWLLEQRTGGVVMYHGTASKYLDSILSSGLEPSPKKRSWAADEGGFYHASRKSIGGIYVTTNLMTASSSALRTAQGSKSNKLYVVMDIHPNSLIGDEDDFMMNAQISSNEYQLSILNAYSILLKNKAFLQHAVKQEYGDYYLKSMQELYEKAKTKFIEDSLRSIKYKMNGMHPSLEARLRELYQSGFDICLARQGAHLDPYTFKKGFWEALSGFGHDLDGFISPQPSKEVAETAYLAFQDKVSRSAKQIAYKNEDKFNHTARIMEPIRFHGRNRILCVVEEVLDTSQGGYRAKGLKVHYGELPDKFKTDWQQSMGELKLLN